MNIISSYSGVSICYRKYDNVDMQNFTKPWWIWLWEIIAPSTVTETGKTPASHSLEVFDIDSNGTLYCELMALKLEAKRTDTVS